MEFSNSVVRPLVFMDLGICDGEKKSFFVDISSVFCRLNIMTK